jgi:hypothetical protein
VDAAYRRETTDTAGSSALCLKIVPCVELSSKRSKCRLNPSNPICSERLNLRIGPTNKIALSSEVWNACATGGVYRDQISCGVLLELTSAT